MTLDEQKNIFLQSTKGQKAIAYAHKWFNDFTDLKLSPTYLAYFYAQEKYNDNVPLSAESEFQNYELMFWFWFYERYQRLMNEQHIAQANIEYEALIKELDSQNLFDWLGLGSFADWASWILIAVGGYFIYKVVKE